MTGTTSDPVSDFKYYKGMSAAELVDALGSVGYQASNLKKAADIITRMRKDGAKIFLSFTSNMASSGLRGLFAQMIARGMVDVVITTVGSIEEDFIKAHEGKFFIGSFDEDDEALGDKGINRIGNILVPSESYQLFEKLVKPALRELIRPDASITPSELIHGLGAYCEDEDSILHQARKMGVPIYCPAITDGSMGFQLQELRNERQFQIDVVADMKNIALEAGMDDKIGIIALGGGVAKHHAILANIINGGADYAVYITTAHQHSGSLSGATTQEAKSWGKIKSEGDAVTVHGDVTLVFPLVLARVFEGLGADI